MLDIHNLEFYNCLLKAIIVSCYQSLFKSSRCNFLCITAALILVFPCKSPAKIDIADTEIVKIRDSGSVDHLINWVVVAEGFTKEQRGDFISRAAQIMDGLLDNKPWKNYKDFINVIGIFGASEESGADKPLNDPPISRNTAFDATYGTYGMQRLLTVNEGEVNKVVIAKTPFYDLIIVIVNDAEYGGSGGSLVTFSLNSNAPMLALHELGHVIGDLADEYTSPYPDYPEDDSEPNVTYQTKRENIPWKVWIDTQTPIPTPVNFGTPVIGLFEGARYLLEGIYRPKHNCAMRSINAEFCEICSEAQILAFYKYVTPIEKPEATTNVLFSGEMRTFSIALASSTPDYKISWILDGKVLVGEGDTSVFVDTSTLSTDSVHRLEVSVSDTTEMVRQNRNELTFKRLWNLEYDSQKQAPQVIIKDDVFSGETKAFSVTVPGGGDYRVEWFLDGNLLPEEKATLQLDTSKLTSKHTLKAVLINITTSISSGISVENPVLETTWNLQSTGKPVPLPGTLVLFFLFPTCLLKLLKKPSIANLTSSRYV